MGVGLFPYNDFLVLIARVGMYGYNIYARSDGRHVNSCIFIPLGIAALPDHLP